MADDSKRRQTGSLASPPRRDNGCSSRNRSRDGTRARPARRSRAHPRPRPRTRARTRRGARGRGPRGAGRGVRCRQRRFGRAGVRCDRRDRRAARHPRQQRRSDVVRAVSRDDRGRLGSAGRRQPDGHLPVHARRASRNAPAGLGSHRQHLVDRGQARWRVPGTNPLLGRQGRRAGIHEGDRPRGGRRRRHRQTRSRRAQWTPT